MSTRSKLLLALVTGTIAAAAAFGVARHPALYVLRHRASPALPGEELSGGATTVADTGRNAFGRPAMNLVGGAGSQRWLDFRQGKMLFDRDWSREKFAGSLGPRFSATSCRGCHVKDGRGRPPLSPSEPPVSMVMQLSVARQGGGIIPSHPAYGTQLNYHAAAGPPEGSFAVSYDEIAGEYADGESYTLLLPRYEFRGLAYGALGDTVLISPRVAPANFGLGLLEAIPAGAIMAHADPGDADGDGISGRANHVRDIASGRTMTGRFGWKGNQPTISQQVATAFLSDIGITSPLFPVDPQAPTDRRGPSSPELRREELDLMLLYLKLLTAPKRRHWSDPTVLKGREIFSEIGCDRCHTPTFTTGDAPGFPELAGQTIHPYTDLLLHDMGEKLADGRPDGEATGREWRTPPLWGIGLLDNVNGHTRLLHDGRARSLAEAILWHGGEAGRSQRIFLRLGQSDREALLAFLESL